MTDKGDSVINFKTPQRDSQVSQSALMIKKTANNDHANSIFIFIL